MAWHRPCKECGQDHEDTIGDQMCADCRLAASPELSRHFGSAEAPLLTRLDALIGTIRTKEYEAHKDFEETANKFFEGQAEAFDLCAILLTDLVKSG